MEQVNKFRRSSRQRELPTYYVEALKVNHTFIISQKPKGERIKLCNYIKHQCIWTLYKFRNRPCATKLYLAFSFGQPSISRHHSLSLIKVIANLVILNIAHMYIFIIVAKSCSVIICYWRTFTYLSWPKCLQLKLGPGPRLAWYIMKHFLK